MALPVNIEELIHGNTIEWELSYPGPMPPVTATVIRTQRHIVAREYRNRRIGDFLKELRLTEGRGTGFPTIYGAMEANGSPEPVFETDADSTYFLVTLPAHTSGSIGVGIEASLLTFNDLGEIIAFGNGAGRPALAIIGDTLHDRVPEMLSLLLKKLKRKELFEGMDLSNQSKNRARYLDPLISIGWVSMEFPDEPTHPNQAYFTTASGKRILSLIDPG